MPDRIHIEGSLSSHNDAPISIFMRRGNPFKGTPGLVWDIQGESGAIRVEAQGSAITAFDYPTKILVEDLKSGKVENVTWKDEMAERGFEGSGKNIGKLYELFAEGKKGSWPTLEDALERHRFLEDFWKYY